MPLFKSQDSHILCRINLEWTKYINTHKLEWLYAVAYLGFHFGGGFKFFLEKFVRGVWGHAPPRKFLKMVQFGAF